ncbi:ABC transporter ATP-binding protein [Halegenticoccus soli]|uniref:ABC transporter ATP-binding protein n=1 Tax=Halegenticoccus soli TaxID=1985678 RepID=UPI0018EC014F|nr:phosphate ABC transporter ATP-binding protein [Halegenticoccus soli]
MSPEHRKAESRSPSIKLEARELTRVVDGVRIVDSISVRIREFEVFVVVGPSGSGKSSFLRLLNRLDEPTEGTVLLDGVDYREYPPRELRKRVGLVPQDPALVDGSVYENVVRGPGLRGEAVDDRRVETTLRRLGLDGYAERDAADLSGGEAQRVALARTLVNGPEVLLLDEPTSSLDSRAEARVESLLRDLSLTVVLVTHDERQAERLGERAMRLRDGRVERIGTAREVVA